MHYLQTVINTAAIDNILEQYLFTVLGSVEGMAAVRARAILHIKVIEPLRFFANDSELGLSPVMKVLFFCACVSYVTCP